MVDLCTITRAGGVEEFDPDTGEYTTPAGSTIYSGVCEVQVSDGLNARESEAGGTELTLSRVTVRVPLTVDDVEPGDIVTIDSSEADPALETQEFRVVTVVASTHATARRLQVERVTT